MRSLRPLAIVNAQRSQAPRAHLERDPHVPKEFSDELIEQLANEADVHPATIMRRALGLPVKRRASGRADRVLEKHGLLPKTKENARSRKAGS